MKCRINKNCLLCFLISLLPIITEAQSIERNVLSVAGENLSNGGYTMHFTMGETVAQTFTNGRQLSQGFQQVWLITTSVEEGKTADWDINVFPNPTEGILTIETEEQAKIRMSDMAGRIVVEKNIEPGTNTIDLSQFPQGIYNLMLYPEQKTDIKSLRIVRVQ